MKVAATTIPTAQPSRASRASRKSIWLAACPVTQVREAAGGGRGPRARRPSRRRRRGPRVDPVPDHDVRAEGRRGSTEAISGQVRDLRAPRGDLVERPLGDDPAGGRLGTPGTGQAMVSRYARCVESRGSSSKVELRSWRCGAGEAERRRARHQCPEHHEPRAALDPLASRENVPSSAVTSPVRRITHRRPGTGPASPA